MDAFHGRVHRCRAKALAHPEIGIDTSLITTLFNQTMSAPTDIDHVVVIG
jgi:hypothetical protein